MKKKGYKLFEYVERKFAIQRILKKSFGGIRKSNQFFLPYIWKRIFASYLNIPKRNSQYFKKVERH